MALQLSLFEPEPPRSGPPVSSAGRVLIARGALAAEAWLLERVAALLEETRRDPALLALPVRIVVPSRSLRLHLGAAIVRTLGRPAAGVLIQTLNGLALEVLERSGERAPRGEPLFGLVAQRLARAEPALRRGLEGLADGYAAVAGTVRDLLDAGLEPVHAAAAEEALAADGRHAGSRAEVERAIALVRIAARTEELLSERGLGRASHLLRRAMELLEADPERCLPARAVLVHGFADATGVATDFIQSLLRRRAAWLLLDRPPEAGAAVGVAAAGVERAFTERFAERLAAVAPLEAPPPSSGEETPPVPRVAGFEAAGGDAEVREVAVRVRDLLEKGARAEAIAVVARDLGRYRLPLRRHFGRLGVPFSAVGERGALLPAGRRARAFLELMRRGEDVPSDRWLDAMAANAGFESGRRGGPVTVDLRLAFYALGAGRLRDIAGLALDDVLRDRDSYPLPVRQGLRAAGADMDAEEGDLAGDLHDGREGETYAARRRIAGSQLRGAVRAAARIRARLALWPEEARAAEHWRRLRTMLTADLGWTAKAEEARPVFAAIESLAAQVPADFPLGRDELRQLLARELAKAGTDELGGGLGAGGGGVQVLTVMEARGRTFEHLFVLGLNRDLFPRTVREDPLLPDALRKILQRVLPDLPVKRSGFDEDRYLFAQLLAASPAVTLSWQCADDDGAPLAVSPLVERLRDGLAVAKAAPLYALPKNGADSGARRPPQPAGEHAVMAALHASRRELAEVLPLAIREADGSALGLEPQELAAARLAVLDELDPDRRTPEGRSTAARLGPYFGFVGAFGPGAGEREPRRRDLYVTHLENLAACPWQLFLVRLLRLEPTPDPLDALPGADPLLLGNLVHAVLDRIVREAGPGVFGPAETRPPLEAVLARDPVAVPWPAAADLDRSLREEAARLLAEEGILLSGLARALAERARPLVEAARDLDWGGPEGALPVLGTEVEGELAVGDASGRVRSLRFKADRLERAGNILRWTDYKTGRPISDKKSADTRRRHFLARVREGRSLQGVAYLLALDSSAAGGLGRYLFLRPELEEREFSIASGDREFIRAFQRAVSSVLAAWDAGSFFPRVVDASGRNEPPRCGFCAVAEACLRGDSGARLRLFEWAERARELEASGQALAPEEAALLAVWRLAAKAEPEAGEDRGAGL